MSRVLAAFGRIEQTVGLLEHGVLARVRREGGHAGRGAEPRVEQRYGRAHTGRDRLGGARVEAGKQEGELVAPDPEGEIVAAAGIGEGGGRSGEQAIPRAMPVPVVDALEVVEVDEDHAALAADREFMVERLVEAPVV